MTVAEYKELQRTGQLVNEGGRLIPIKPLPEFSEMLKKEKKVIRHTETNEHRRVCQYISTKYPDVFYQSDYFSFLSHKLRMSLGVMRKKLSPDLFIAKRSGQYSGLYLEMKASNKTMYTKKGEIVSDLRDQSKVLEALKKEGYAAYFAAGYNEAVRIIDEYLRHCAIAQ